MQEKQEELAFNKSHGDYLVDYINTSHDYIDYKDAVSMSYLGKYESDSKGNVLYFPNLFVRRKYRIHTSSQSRTMFKYEGLLNISNKSSLYECVIEFNIASALQKQCKEIIDKISKKNIEYKVFIDEKDEKLSIHHAIRVAKQLMFILNEDYELVNMYYTDDFFKNYKNKTLEEAKEAVLFFTLCAYNERMRSITKEVDTHNMTIDQMRQYITLVDMIEV